MYWEVVMGKLPLASPRRGGWNDDDGSWNELAWYKKVVGLLPLPLPRKGATFTEAGLRAGLEVGVAFGESHVNLQHTAAPIINTKAPMEIRTFLQAGGSS